MSGVKGLKDSLESQKAKLSRWSRRVESRISSDNSNSEKSGSATNTTSASSEACKQDAPPAADAAQVQEQVTEEVASKLSESEGPNMDNSAGGVEVHPADTGVAVENASLAVEVVEVVEDAKPAVADAVSDGAPPETEVERVAPLREEGTILDHSADVAGAVLSALVQGPSIEEGAFLEAGVGIVGPGQAEAGLSLPAVNDTWVEPDTGLPSGALEENLSSSAHTVATDPNLAGRVGARSSALAASIAPSTVSTATAASMSLSQISLLRNTNPRIPVDLQFSVDSPLSPHLGLDVMRASIASARASSSLPSPILGPTSVSSRDSSLRQTIDLSRSSLPRVHLPSDMQQGSSFIAATETSDPFRQALAQVENEDSVVSASPVAAKNAAAVPKTTDSTVNLDDIIAVAKQSSKARMTEEVSAPHDVDPTSSPAGVKFAEEVEENIVATASSMVRTPAKESGGVPAWSPAGTYYLSPSSDSNVNESGNDASVNTSDVRSSGDRRGIMSDIDEGTAVHFPSAPAEVSEEEARSRLSKPSTSVTNTADDDWAVIVRAFNEKRTAAPPINQGGDTSMEQVAKAIEAPLDLTVASTHQADAQEASSASASTGAGPSMVRVPLHRLKEITSPFSFTPAEVPSQPTVSPVVPIEGGVLKAPPVPENIGTSPRLQPVGMVEPPSPESKRSRTSMAGAAKFRDDTLMRRYLYRRVNDIFNTSWKVRRIVGKVVLTDDAINMIIDTFVECEERMSSLGVLRTWLHGDEKASVQDELVGEAQNTLEEALETHIAEKLAPGQNVRQPGPVGIAQGVRTDQQQAEGLIAPVGSPSAKMTATGEDGSLPSQNQPKSRPLDVAGLVKVRVPPNLGESGRQDDSMRRSAPEGTLQGGKAVADGVNKNLVWAKKGMKGMKGPRVAGSAENNGNPVVDMRQSAPSTYVRVHTRMAEEEVLPPPTQEVSTHIENVATVRLSKAEQMAVEIPTIVEAAEPVQEALGLEQRDADESSSKAGKVPSEPVVVVTEAGSTSGASVYDLKAARQSRPGSSAEPIPRIGGLGRGVRQNRPTTSHSTAELEKKAAATILEAKKLVKSSSGEIGARRRSLRVAFPKENAETVTKNKVNLRVNDRESIEEKVMDTVRQMDTRTDEETKNTVRTSLDSVKSMQRAQRGEEVNVAKGDDLRDRIDGILNRLDMKSLEEKVGNIQELDENAKRYAARVAKSSELLKDPQRASHLIVAPSDSSTGEQRPSDHAGLVEVINTIKISHEESTRQFHAYASELRSAVMEILGNMASMESNSQMALLRQQMETLLSEHRGLILQVKGVEEGKETKKAGQIKRQKPLQDEPVSPVRRENRNAQHAAPEMQNRYHDPVPLEVRTNADEEKERREKTSATVRRKVKERLGGSFNYDAMYQEIADMHAQKHTVDEDTKAHRTEILRIESGPSLTVENDFESQVVKEINARIASAIEAKEKKAPIVPRYRGGTGETPTLGTPENSAGVANDPPKRRGGGGAARPSTGPTTRTAFGRAVAPPPAPRPAAAPALPPQARVQINRSKVRTPVDRYHVAIQKPEARQSPPTKQKDGLDVEQQKKQEHGNNSFEMLTVEQILQVRRVFDEMDTDFDGQLSDPNQVLNGVKSLLQQHKIPVPQPAIERLVVCAARKIHVHEMDAVEFEPFLNAYANIVRVYTTFSRLHGLVCRKRGGLTLLAVTEMIREITGLLRGEKEGAALYDYLYPIFGDNFTDLGADEKRGFAAFLPILCHVDEMGLMFDSLSVDHVLLGGETKMERALSAIFGLFTRVRQLNGQVFNMDFVRRQILEESVQSDGRPRDLNEFMAICAEARSLLEVASTADVYKGQQTESDPGSALGLSEEVLDDLKKRFHGAIEKTGGKKFLTVPESYDALKGAAGIHDDDAILRREYFRGCRLLRLPYPTDWKESALSRAKDAVLSSMDQEHEKELTENGGEDGDQKPIMTSDHPRLVDLKLFISLYFNCMKDGGVNDSLMPVYREEAEPISLDGCGFELAETSGEGLLNDDENEEYRRRKEVGDLMSSNTVPAGEMAQHFYEFDLTSKAFELESRTLRTLEDEVFKRMVEKMMEDAKLTHPDKVPLPALRAEIDGDIFNAKVMQLFMDWGRDVDEGLVSSVAYELLMSKIEEMAKNGELGDVGTGDAEKDVTMPFDSFYSPNTEVSGLILAYLSEALARGEPFLLEGVFHPVETPEDANEQSGEPIEESIEEQRPAPPIQLPTTFTQAATSPLKLPSPEKTMPSMPSEAWTEHLGQVIQVSVQNTVQAMGAFHQPRDEPAPSSAAAAAALELERQRLAMKEQEHKLAMEKKEFELQQRLAEEKRKLQEENDNKLRALEIELNAIKNKAKAERSTSPPRKESLGVVVDPEVVKDDENAAKEAKDKEDKERQAQKQREIEEALKKKEIELEMERKKFEMEANAKRQDAEDRRRAELAQQERDRLARKLARDLKRSKKAATDKRLKKYYREEMEEQRRAREERKLLEELDKWRVQEGLDHMPEVVEDQYSEGEIDTAQHIAREDSSEGEVFPSTLGARKQNDQLKHKKPVDPADSSMSEGEVVPLVKLRAINKSMRRDADLSDGEIDAGGVGSDGEVVGEAVRGHANAPLSDSDDDVEGSDDSLSDGGLGGGGGGARVKRMISGAAASMGYSLSRAGGQSAVRQAIFEGRLGASEGTSHMGMRRGKAPEFGELKVDGMARHLAGTTRALHGAPVDNISEGSSHDVRSSDDSSTRSAGELNLRQRN